jgi:hypothetical protein
VSSRIKVSSVEAGMGEVGEGRVGRDNRRQGLVYVRGGEEVLWWGGDSRCRGHELQDIHNPSKVQPSAECSPGGEAEELVVGGIAEVAEAVLHRGNIGQVVHCLNLHGLKAAADKPGTVILGSLKDFNKACLANILKPYWGPIGEYRADHSVV